MKKINLLLAFLLSTLFILSFKTQTFADSEDFQVDTNTQISYTTGEDFVTVRTIYKRTVKNNSYYFPASGEKTFNIPDLPNITNEEISAERVYKKDSLSITDSNGSNVKYTLDEKELGEGLYINVPNYRQTTSSSPYTLIITYKTHDYVQRANSFVTIQAPALPSDVIFEQRETSNNTLTIFNYNLTIITDNNIAPLAKAFPSSFTSETKDGKTYYTFGQTDRISNAPYLEFGTSVIYQFDLVYTTPKTDSLIPKEYTELLKALSTNVYEVSLPREFSETNQRVFFTKVEPKPTDVYRDTEGNIIATFEVPANQESQIILQGYISLEQDSYSTERLKNLEITLNDYKQKISGSSFVSDYLSATKYWEVEDDYIKQIAQDNLKDQITLLDLISADYKFVNDTLEYDESKANSANERIGAKAALQGGASVCMEYADSMIAILRAQGIPSRAALGYANLNYSSDSSDQKIRHQWVQIWVPDYGWLSIDPTLESNNMKIGQAIDRILWETFNNDTLSNIRIFSANSLTDMTAEGYSIKIYPATNTENIDFESLDSFADLIPEKNYGSTEDIPESTNRSIFQWINTFLKTTVLGKALIITIPVLLGIVLITIVILSVKTIIKRIKNRKEKSKI